eukprot:CAMPEP_0119344092 /NCGR_PEP_ID=MMETSP1333-20130426/106791_1 /TAXON_ID=418940 /ORGANISM="Scyphosphaera apsteinii, Strain RCC1455" /LENGTH=325 /DNA_ID=CAMNT_0007356515 /DNA_START=34 /DNA_END=1012 /DNA_ORIENTATION=+
MSAERLAMSLDEMIEADGNTSQGAGKGAGKAPRAAVVNRASRRPMPYRAPPPTGRSSARGNAYSFKGEKGCCVYVGNLAYSVSWQDLKDHFKAAGDVVHADVMSEPGTGRSKGCGLVVFSNARDAQKAITMLHDTDLLGRPIFVREDREAAATERAWHGPFQGLRPRCLLKRTRRTESDHNAADTQLLGRPIFVREDREAAATRSPAPVAQAGHTSAISGGFGSGGFAGRAAAAVARSSVAGVGGETPGCKVFVGNLHFDTTWKDLKDLFREAGVVSRADIAQTPDGRSKGYGNVIFGSSRDAAKAIQLFNDSEHLGRILQVHPS